MPLTLHNTNAIQRGGYATPYFLITGTGRNATAYISQVLREAGITTGHETNYHPFYPKYQHFDGAGEASWLTAPHIANHPGPVLHQTRHPLKVIASLQHPDGFMAGAYSDNPYWKYKLEHVPTLADTWDPIINAITFILHWYDLINAADPYTYQVEQLTTNTLTQITKQLGWPISDHAAAAALEVVPTNVNQHSETRLELGWDDLPDNANTDRLHHLTEGYGYT